MCKNKCLIKLHCTAASPLERRKGGEVRMMINQPGGNLTLVPSLPKQSGSAIKKRVAEQLFFNGHWC